MAAYSYRLQLDGKTSVSPEASSDDLVTVLKALVTALREGQTISSFYVGAPMPPVDDSAPKTKYLKFLIDNKDEALQLWIPKGKKNPPQRDHWVRLVDLRLESDNVKPRWVWYGAETERTKKARDRLHNVAQLNLKEWDLATHRGLPTQLTQSTVYQRMRPKCTFISDLHLDTWRAQLESSAIYVALLYDPCYKKFRAYVGQMTRLGSRWLTSPYSNTWSHYRDINASLSIPLSLPSTCLTADVAIAAAIVHHAQQKPTHRSETGVWLFIVEEVDTEDLDTKEVEWMKIIAKNKQGLPLLLNEDKLPNFE
jgi:hypothetical protein